MVERRSSRSGNGAAHPGLSVGAVDPDLDARLSAELDRHNFSAVGVDDLLKLTVEATDPHGALVGGLSGWT